MAVSFEDAVATLHGMFSSYDRDTLGRILTQNNYHMENTVEAILKLEGEGDKPAEDTSGDAELAARLAAELNQQPTMEQAGASSGVPPSAPQAAAAAGGGGGAKPAGPKGRGALVTLPDGFLRIPGGGVASSTSHEQLLSDEQLARMLQNEMFREELERDAELSRYVNEGGGGGAAASRTSAGQAGGSPSNKPSMMTRFGSMSSAARARLSAMAVRFNNRQGGAAQRPGGHDYEHVPLNSGALVDDDEDVEVQFDTGIQMDAIRSPMQDMQEASGRGSASSAAAGADDYGFVDESAYSKRDI
uniref:CUE domain-containing protein n=1 Tax=Phaeomonas parva TaxID=124430 RepID=A0A7S1U322_9STRA|mmetsp:Transcript_26977/g.84839  ORF Transcript_26977/g.84839 Transcript_26977/m.84839 type:complete len:302 (+) Transcript_26977:226-1131(+)